MNKEDIIEDLKAALKRVADNGHTIISPAALRAFLAEEEPLVTNLPWPDEAEHREKNRNKLILSATAPDPGESYKAAIEAGQTAINVAILLNGGAAVAFLAFLGSILSRSPLPNFGAMIFPLFIFACGALTAARASFQRYCSQDVFTDVHIWASTGERSRGERDERRRIAREFQEKAVSNCRDSLRLFFGGLVMGIVALSFWPSAPSSTTASSQGQAVHQFRAERCLRPPAVEIKSKAYEGPSRGKPLREAHRPLPQFPSSLPLESRQRMVL
ncbi:hypothetical protein [Cupriavidus necator]